MGIATQKVTLDLTRKPAVPQVVHLGQGDKAATTLQATIMNDGEPFSLSNYTVRFCMMLPDQEHYYSVNGTKSGNVATFQIDETTAAGVEGETSVAYVEVLSGSTVIASTSRMSVHILKSARDGLEPPESWSSAIAEAEAAAQAITDMTVATQSQKGLMSPEDKMKLDSFATPIAVAAGGTGKTTHTSNAVLLGNGTNAVKNKATANGAFYATGFNSEPSFGTLPVAQGGTGSTSAEAARTALGAASQSDMTAVQDSISKWVFFQNHADKFEVDVSSSGLVLTADVGTDRYQLVVGDTSLKYMKKIDGTWTTVWTK